MSGRILPGLATPGNATSYAPGSRTIPDLTLGSLAADFDAEAAEEELLRQQNGAGYGRNSPDFSEDMNGREMPPDSPSTVMGRSMSRDTQSPVRPSRSRTSTGRSGRSDRYDQNQNENLAVSTRASNKVWLAVGNGTEEDDADDLMSQKLDLDPSPQWEISNEDAMRSVGRHARRATDGGTDALERIKGRPRHSVATTGNESSIIRENGGRPQLSLREQAKKTQEQDNEIWKLKLELSMLTSQLKQGLGQDAAELTQRLIKHKTESAAEIIRWKKASTIVSEQLTKSNERVLDLEYQLDAARQDDSSLVDELQEQLLEEQEKRREDQARIVQLEDALHEARRNEHSDESFEQMEDEAEAARIRATKLEEDNKQLQEQVEDLQHELQNAFDERDRAVEAAEDKADSASNEDVKRLENDILDLEADKASLAAELEALRVGARARDEQRQQDQERISLLVRELEQAKVQTIDLQRSVSRTGNLEVEHERLARLVSDRENEILHLKEELDRLDAKVHTQARDMLAYQEDLDEMVEKLRRLQAERNEIAENLNETMTIIEDKNEELRESQDQLDQALDQLEQLKEDLAVMARERDAFKNELAQADSDIDRVDESRDEIASNLAEVEAELVQTREAEATARQDLQHQRLTIDELSRKLGDLEVRHRQDVDSQRKLVQERDEMQSTVRRTESAHSEETQRLRKELSSELERYKQLISDKEQSNVRLSHEIEAVRERISERDRDVRDLQNALKGLESDKRRIGDDHMDDRRSLELEIDRVKRDLLRSQDDLEHAQQEIDRLETSLSQQRAELSEMAEDKSSIESLLTSERQERLKLSDKLNAAEKSAKQAEHELVALRERIEELERNSGPSRTLTPRRGSDMAQKDASTLLQSIYIKVAKLCGIEEHGVPSNFSTLKDNLLRRLRQLQSTNSEWERQIRSLEIRLESQTSALSRELDAKKKLLDGVEHSVQKMTQTKLSWKTKLTMKDDEVADLRGRLKDLQFQLSTLKMSSTTESSTEVKTLQSRATHAEKRAATLANQLSALQEASATHESRHQTAVSKWEARVREYEKRLREAGEMIKVEKQGGKERVADLEQQLRSLSAQRDAINAKTIRLESIMNMAGMGRKDDPDAL